LGFLVKRNSVLPLLIGPTGSISLAVERERREAAPNGCEARFLPGAQGGLRLVPRQRQMHVMLWSKGPAVFSEFAAQRTAALRKRRRHLRKIGTYAGLSGATTGENSAIWGFSFTRALNSRYTIYDCWLGGDPELRTFRRPLGRKGVQKCRSSAKRSAAPPDSGPPASCG